METFERKRRVASWVALFLACVVMALTARARSSTCQGLVEVPNPELSPSEFPRVALPGARRDHSWALGHEFDQELGGFRLECHTTNDGHYWDYDHCVLEVPACSSKALDIDRYGMITTDLELHRGPRDLYVLTNRRATPYLAFRAEPTARRVSAGLLTTACFALALSMVSLVMARMARARLVRFATWHDGVVTSGHTVTPEVGGGRLALSTLGLIEGTSVLFSPPRETVDYRSVGEPVEARKGSRDELLQSSEALEKRARVLAAISMAVNLAVAGLVLASG